jgi:hypothetical protein
MDQRSPAFAPPRLTAYGLWLVASRLGGPVLAVLALADLVRGHWG